MHDPHHKPALPLYVMKHRRSRQEPWRYVQLHQTHDPAKPYRLELVPTVAAGTRVAARPDDMAAFCRVALLQIGAGEMGADLVDRV